MSMTELITYDVGEAEIAEMRDKYMGLKVANINDKASYELCRKSRKEVRAHRISVENRRKALKSESLDFGRQVDAKAKEITAGLVDIENHLKSQEDVIDDEQRRIKAEAEKREKENFEYRVGLLQKYNIPFEMGEVSGLSEDGFQFMIADGKRLFEAAEAKRIADEKELVELRAKQAEQNRIAEDREAENRRLTQELEAKERAEFLAAQKKLDEERRELEAKQKADADTKAEAERIAQEKRDAVAKEIEDEQLLARIQNGFPTIESAWIEIARLFEIVEGKDV